MATRNRIRSSKPRRDKPRNSTTVFRGLFVAAIFLLLAFQGLKLYNGVPTVNYVTQYVSVPKIGNLLSHDFVRIGGTRVGQVVKIDVGENGKPLVKLQLDPGTKLPEGTRVVIRANGLLGARYVELVPGTSKRLLANASTIGGGTTSYTNGLPEAVETFDEQTRGGLRTTIDQAAVGVTGNGAGLNGTIRNLRIGAPQFSDTVRAILARKGAAARFLPSFERAFRALAPTKPYLRPGFPALQQSLAPFNDERPSTQQTIADAPTTLRAIDTGFPPGERLLASIRNFSQAAAGTLPTAPAAFTSLNRLLEILPHNLDLVEPPLRHDRLPKGAYHGPHQVFEEIVAQGTLPYLEQTVSLIHKPLAEIARRSCDIENFGPVMRSMTGFGQSGADTNYTGPLGPAMAFRLVATVPSTLGNLGIDDPRVVREGSGETPCKYLSTPYAQIDGAGTTRKAGKR